MSKTVLPMQRMTVEGLPLSDDGKTVHIAHYFESLPSMQARFDRTARRKAFSGSTLAEWLSWADATRKDLFQLLGMDLLERCDLHPKITERVEIDGGAIVRERIELEVEPGCIMPLYALIPQNPPAELVDKESRLSCFVCPHGHQGGGKYSVAGVRGVPVIDAAIDRFGYDYGLRIAREGYVALCPDARGFGERRDLKLQGDEESQFMRAGCVQLAHMAEPLGLTVAGLLTWDLMRLIDYVAERGKWRLDNLGCLGFSGGGMQTLWLAALDTRVTKAFISGYLYGYKDALLTLNNNCSCNYVPGLWQCYDMGDIASLIAPRPLIVQSCTEDHLNGARGIKNVQEQLEVVRVAYDFFEAQGHLAHDVCPGEHHFSNARLSEQLAWLEHARY